MAHLGSWLQVPGMAGFKYTQFSLNNMTNQNLSGIRRKYYKAKLCVGENLSLLFRISQDGLEVFFFLKPNRFL